MPITLPPLFPGARALRGSIRDAQNLSPYRCRRPSYYTKRLPATSCAACGLPALHQRPPAFGFHLDAVLPGGRSNPPPGGVALRLADAFNLVETSDGVAHVTCVVQRLLALLGKSECSSRHAVLLSRAQSC